jgi:hypothetical protein
MFCRPVILCLLNRITETIQVPVGCMLVCRDLTCHWIHFCADTFSWGGGVLNVMSSPGLLNPCWPWRHFGMRKCFLTPSSSKPEQNTKATFKTSSYLFIETYITILIRSVKTCWNGDTIAHIVNCIFSKILIFLSVCILLYRKIYR